MIDTKQFRNFEDVLREELRDPREAESYLEVAIDLYEEDGDKEAFLMALQDVAEAQGGLDHLAMAAKLNQHKLLTLFSKKENPRIGPGLGMKPMAQPVENSNPTTPLGR